MSNRHERLQRGLQPEGKGLGNLRGRMIRRDGDAWMRSPRPGASVGEKRVWRRPRRASSWKKRLKERSPAKDQPQR